MNRVCISIKCYYHLDAAARAVLHDWNFGKIKYYCKPPKVSQSNVDSLDKETIILDSFTRELDIDELKEEDIQVINEIEAQKVGHSSYFSIDRVADHIDIHIGDSNDDSIKNNNSIGLNNSNKTKDNQSKLTYTKLVSMETGSNSMISSVAEDGKTIVSRISRSTNKLPDQLESLIDIDDPTAVGNNVRKLQKKMKKKAIKNVRRQDKELEKGEDYDFEKDFEY